MLYYKDKDIHYQIYQIYRKLGSLLRPTLLFSQIVKRTRLRPFRGTQINRYLIFTQQERAFALSLSRMSDSEDDPSVPDAATAQKLCKEFEAVTNTDEIMGQMYLQVRAKTHYLHVICIIVNYLLFQEHGWDLSKALNSFFAKKCEKIEADKAAEVARAVGPFMPLGRRNAEAFGPPALLGHQRY